MFYAFLLIFRLARLLAPGDEHAKYLNLENICSYVQRLHRIHQDDWNLEWIQEPCNQEARNFVYHCTLLPAHRSSAANLLKLGKCIQYSLKLYLSIVVMESKLQSQLLYFLRAVMKHLS